MSNRIRLVSLFLLAAQPAFAQGEPTPPTPPTPPTTGEPVPPTPPTPPTPPPTPPPVVVVAPEPAKPEPEKKPEPPPAHAKFDTTIYGFVEFDSMWDSTQGLTELIGNSALPRPNTYTGDHGQLTNEARNSRIGLKVAAPVYEDIKASAQLEMDFLGNQPPGLSESALFQNATFRFRHMNLKLETKPFDILIGQYWQLFGFQSYFHPNTVQIQGIPGQIYSRAPQVRIGKVIKSPAIDVDLEVAASRSQRASSTPDGTVGVKLMFNKAKVWHTAGSTGSGLDSAAVSLSAVGRRFAVDELSAAPGKQVVKNGYGFDLNALIPIATASKENHGNSAALNLEAVYGFGIADYFQSLSGGVSNPALPNPDPTKPAPVYTPNIDNGLVMFASDGTLHAVQWTSFLAGLQYYLPPKGHVWLSTNVAYMNSGNDDNFGALNKTFNKSLFADGNVFVDVTPAVRFGLEFAWFNQTYNDGVDASNYRVQGSAFFIF